MPPANSLIPLLQRQLSPVRLLLTAAIVLTLVGGVVLARWPQQPPIVSLRFATQPLALDTPEVVNPMRGLYRWQNQEQVPLPRLAFDAYNRYEWRTLEHAPDQYDFSAIDRDIAQAASEGRRFSFRVRAVVSTKGSAVPDYLMQRMPKGWWADYNKDGRNDTYVPDWNDPAFLERAAQLLQALGARYNHDPRIGWVDIGMYGNWGEWHMSQFTYPSPTGAERITTTNKYKLVDMHIAAFPDTMLVSMTDDTEALVYAMQRSPRIGWRRDSLGWDHFEQVMKDAQGWDAIKDRWKTAPVVTEFAGLRFQHDPDVYQLATDQVKRYHISLVSNGNSLPWNTLSPAGQAGYALLGKTTGYRLVLNDLSLSGRLAPNAPLRVDTSWSNLGVAPTYVPWHVMLQLRRPDSPAVVWEGQSGLDLQTVLPTADASPDQPLTHSDQFTLPGDLAPGTYTLVVLVRASVSTLPPLALAIGNRNPDGSYRLGTVTIP